MRSGMLWAEDEDEHEREYVHDYDDAGTRRDPAQPGVHAAFALGRNSWSSPPK